LNIPFERYQISNISLLHILAVKNLPSLIQTAVKVLLATGKVDVDSKDSNGQTPLSRAAGRGYEAVVKALLATGKVDVDSKVSSGQTPLSRAAGRGYEAVVKALLATGKVDVDSKDSNARTPLSWAAGGGHEAVVKVLRLHQRQIPLPHPPPVSIHPLYTSYT
jgi:ankyrin repeat protein